MQWWIFYCWQLQSPFAARQVIEGHSKYVNVSLEHVAMYTWSYIITFWNPTSLLSWSGAAVLANRYVASYMVYSSDSQTKLCNCNFGKALKSSNGAFCCYDYPCSLRGWFKSSYMLSSAVQWQSFWQCVHIQLAVHTYIQYIVKKFLGSLSKYS